MLLLVPALKPERQICPVRPIPAALERASRPMRIALSVRKYDRPDAGPAGRLRSVVIAGRKPIDYFYEPFVVATPASGLAEKGPDPGTAP